MNMEIVLKVKTYIFNENFKLKTLCTTELCDL